MICSFQYEPVLQVRQIKGETTMKKPVSYTQAGVDIDAGEEFVRRIGPLARSTYRQEVVTDLGGFGSVIGIDWKRHADPLLVASTDGVGTKLRIAFSMNRHETVGIDLVAMCANDVLVHGAEPLFFLDYFATGKLDIEQAQKVLKGIAAGCRDAGCALVGGETAEMPSFYTEGEYELAGFCVGIVDRSRLLDGGRIFPGDLLLGLASSGLHSNGYSLVRRLFLQEKGYSLDEHLPGSAIPLGEELLRPTRIYVKPILQLLEKVPVKGLAHITGGGLLRNIPRILPESCRAIIRVGRWPVPGIFTSIAKEGNVPLEEMLQTFNYGIGMVVVVDPRDEAAARRILTECGEEVHLIGEIAPRTCDADQITWTND